MLECESHATAGAIEIWVSCALLGDVGFICAQNAGSMALEQPGWGLTSMVSVALSAIKIPSVRSAT